MVLDNYSRDLIFRWLTHSESKKEISRAIRENLSRCKFKISNIGYTCYMCTQRYQSQLAYSL